MAEIFFACPACGYSTIGSGIEHTRERCLVRQLTALQAKHYTLANQYDSTTELLAKTVIELSDCKTAVAAAHAAWSNLRPHVRPERIRYLVTTAEVEELTAARDTLDKTIGYGEPADTRQLIADLRGGAPCKCDFCEHEGSPDEMEPEEAGMWACPSCWQRFRAEDAAGIEARRQAAAQDPKEST